ncbi:MAG: TatD family hydrolase [Verrucomicrobiota bacterium JB022]|nr:TatD family hydrolase [Verrucomicrobiota bacterium JB022]
MLIDSHCHFEKAAQKGNVEAWLQNAREHGVERHITIGTSLKDWPRYYKLAQDYPGVIDWTVGIHPCEVEEDWEDQFKSIASYFATDPLPVALGEIGLDHFHLPKYPDEAAEVKQRQVQAFKAQLSLAYQLDCPVVIHSRQAFHESVKLIDESGVDWRKVVFHCFSEGAEEVRILNERGGRASFTGIITYKSAANVREAMLAQGIDRLMVETDSPYLPPEPHRGKPNEPAFVRFTAERCAELLGVDFRTLEARVEENTRAFFGLK